MAGIITNIGERRFLDAALLNMGVLTVHLAKMPFTPTDSNVTGDFTEADYEGYAPQHLGYIGLEPGSPGGKAVANFSANVFTCTGIFLPNSIYGYWVQNTGNEVILAERFTGLPRPMVAPLQTVRIAINTKAWSPI